MVFPYLCGIFKSRCAWFYYAKNTISPVTATTIGEVINITPEEWGNMILYSTTGFPWQPICGLNGYICTAKR